MAGRKSAVERAIEAGFDISLIETSLGYSYEQRVLQHQAALDLALELERAGRELRDSAPSTHRKTLRR
jgi:hypothetical protein